MATRLTYLSNRGHIFLSGVLIKFTRVALFYTSDNLKQKVNSVIHSLYPLHTLLFHDLNLVFRSHIKLCIQITVGA